MESRTYYYARVSSREQNLDRQFAAFAALGAQERDIIADKESGKSINRSGYTALKSALLRRGDTLVIKSLDRLSRNKEDTKRELQYFRENGIRLKVLDLPTTMIEYPVGQEWVLDMVNNILVEVLASIAQQERETIHQRQAEGIAAAKQRGKHLGRPSIELLVDGHSGFLFLDKSGMPKVAMHLENYMRHVRKKYATQQGTDFPNVTPHVLRHTFCTNAQRAGIDVKSLQYFMGHSNASVTLDVYTHSDYDSAEKAFQKIAMNL